MAKEIERKYLVKSSALGNLKGGIKIKQGYIPTADKTVVRIRISGPDAYLTLKGENKGLTRSEFEYSIPVADAEQMIAELCKGPTIDKTRYLVNHQGHDWEVDVFHCDNEGLVVAEIELSEEDEDFATPEWVTMEVSGDPRYYNSNLLEHPYTNW